MKIDPIASVLYSELVLSLYPLLIKGVSTNLFTQILARFYSISNIPTVVFSLMSFIGVAFGYAWTILFTEDKITMRALLGGGLIAGSIAILRYFDLQ